MANWTHLDLFVGRSEPGVGLSSAAAVRLLKQSPKLERLSMPQAAVDETFCTAVEAHPAIKRLKVYQLNGEQPLGDALQQRLRKRFDNDFEVQHE